MNSIDRKSGQRVRSAVAELLHERRFQAKPELRQKRRAKAPKVAPLIAYDLETSRIRKGTPRPKYITAYAQDRMHYASEVRDMAHLAHIVETEFLTEENQGCRFVAWNGNRFDAFFIAAALVTNPKYRLRPYLTKNKTLRGLRVSLAEDGDKRTNRTWEFLDGIAMLGLVGVKLSKLLDTFAPDHPKMVDAIDFERESFDPKNPKHCAYAMQDSIGLWHAMTRAQRIMLDTFGEPLGVTMGGACIKIFSAHIPRDVVCESGTADAEKLLFDYVLRGGFCFLARRYEGPVWKYDLNQAYAAAMRDAALPCGGMVHRKGTPPFGKPYIVRVTARNPANRIPFYYRTHDGLRMRSMFGTDEIADTWITSIEYEQLIREGWRITATDCWYWADSFNMRDYVDRLERLRTTCEGGPSGPIGTMVKATGNHSYGKTIEQIEPIEYVLAPDCPDGFEPYYGDDANPIEHIYYRLDNDRRPKAYHKPQLGAFITAHVRMVLRRAALLAPDAWIYADTDCVVFSRDVTHELDIDAKRYGAWKIEDEGTDYLFIAKKVYTQRDGKKRSAKGLNVNRLTADDFEQWFEGSPPEQTQVQIQNFLAVMRGAEMYREQTRRGTAVEIAR